jgi:hypothetical protein
MISVSKKKQWKVKIKAKAMSRTSEMEERRWCFISRVRDLPSFGKAQAFGRERNSSETSLAKEGAFANSNRDLRGSLFAKRAAIESLG